MKLIRINKTEYRLIAFIDANGQSTADHTQAVKVLAQRLDEERPRGYKQRYHLFSVNEVHRTQ